jgi:hypothetical protein
MKARPKEEFPTFDPAALDALIGDARSPEDFAGLMRALQKRLAERMLAGELTAHLGYAPGRSPPGRRITAMVRRRRRC